MNPKTREQISQFPDFWNIETCNIAVGVSQEIGKKLLKIFGKAKYLIFPRCEPRAIFSLKPFHVKVVRRKETLFISSAPHVCGDTNNSSENAVPNLIPSTPTQPTALPHPTRIPTGIVLT